VPELQSDIPSFVSVSNSVSDSGWWSSYPPSSYFYSGGLPCTDCLSRLCVVRDDTGRIVDIYYQDENGTYIRVPECGYYGSTPESGSYYRGYSGGGGGGGGGGDICCPPDGNEYVLEYDFVVFGQRYVGVGGNALWTGTQWWSVFEDYSTPCNVGPTADYLGISATFFCNPNGLEVDQLILYCGGSFCALVTADFDITVVGCPGNPTFYLTIRPGRCASGSFVLRPAGA
jgi:hypothetical protein